ncbi:GrlR family regulatory protein [Bradyrhizobium sp. USDA 10063]
MGLLAAAWADDDAPGNAGAMAVTNGLYTIQIEMTEGGQGRANGVIVLHDGRIAGGDSYFYYSGSYSADRGKWRGELTTSEHTKSAGVLPLFGGRDVTCGFTGLYSADSAQVSGTALVGKTSVMFVARLMLRSKL